MSRGLQEPSFLLAFEGETNPWKRSEMVGRKISELRKSYLAMTNEQRQELAKTGEVELKSGLALMGQDKRTIQELIALVDPPSQ